jgi:hypothetical protein
MVGLEENVNVITTLNSELLAGENRRHDLPSCLEERHLIQSLLELAGENQSKRASTCEVSRCPCRVVDLL